MATTITGIAKSIDCMYPPTSVRNLASRFRYAGIQPGELPKTVSMRALAARVNEGTSRKIEFLSYNTWLLEADFKIADLVKAAGGISRFITCVGLSAADLLAGVLRKVGTSGICDALFPPIFSVCGVSANPANNACKLVGGAVELAGWLIGKFGEGLDVVLSLIFDVLEAPMNLVVDIVFELLALTIGHPIELTVQNKPEIEQRIKEIGAQLPGYDLVALCEVWKPGFRNGLLSPGSFAGFPPGPFGTALTGPAEPSLGDWQHLGSGLLVSSKKFMITDGGNELYWKAGVQRSMPGGCDFGMMVDSDLWARKGIQLTLVNTGFGFIELYSTHLYSGGDMLGDAAVIFGGEPTEIEKAEVRRAQIDQLGKFIAKNHNPGNVAIIAGDFNIGYEENLAYGTGRLAGYLSVVSNLGFDDWYTLAPFAKEYTGPEIDHGNTNRADGVWTFDSHCKNFDRDKGKPKSIQNNQDYYCDELAVPKAIPPEEKVTGNRIDYIFVQRPVAEHTFNLDVSRIRRRAFKRLNPQPAFAVPVPQDFMSDHLGLEVTLYASPRTG